jgi:hypothetical protein
LADYRTNLTKEVISEVRKYFGEKVYASIIPRTVKLTEAPGFGKPIAIYDPASIGAKKYEDVVKEMLGIKDGIEKTEELSEKDLCPETVLNKGDDIHGNQECGKETGQGA